MTNDVPNNCDSAILALTSQRLKGHQKYITGINLNLFSFYTSV